MDERLTKPYNPADNEARIYKKWEESGFFNPDNLPQTHIKPFTVIMPPPNANGRLHAGHGLVMALEDTMVRYKRMRGFKALWVPGADHAGFETQIVYEKKLEKEGRTRFGMEREALYNEILAFTLENKKHMEADVRALGASCDWSREKFTLDADVIAETQRTFKKMFDDGLLYRGKRIVNWCSKHQTSLSDVETEFIERTDPFYYFKYGPFVIGTARPETKFGDKYVVMHPEDERYTQYTDGQKIELEWINGPITATVIKDASIDREFGTGVMTITPWPDDDQTLMQPFAFPAATIPESDASSMVVHRGDDVAPAAAPPPPLDDGGANSIGASENTAPVSKRFRTLGAKSSSFGVSKISRGERPKMFLCGPQRSAISGIVAATQQSGSSPAAAAM
jgi:valyl-tRNA synthetase